MAELTRRDLARLIDHTLLAPEATAADVERFSREGVVLGVGAVCVSPTMVSVAVAVLPSDFVVASVVGFPSGAHLASVKASEAERACVDGAREIDMVINLAAVGQGRWDEISSEVSAVRRAIDSDVMLKVIIESALWGDDQIAKTCVAAVSGGADFVKTSTGYHKSGGATEHAVSLMRRTVGSEIGVKASGGVRTLASTIAMIEAGANRIGTSSAAAILEQAAQELSAADS